VLNRVLGQVVPERNVDVEQDIQGFHQQRGCDARQALAAQSSQTISPHKKPAR
jgi:hypothetical protein